MKKCNCTIGRIDYQYEGCDAIYLNGFEEHKQDLIDYPHETRYILEYNFCPFCGDKITVWEKELKV